MVDAPLQPSLVPDTVAETGPRRRVVIRASTGLAGVGLRELAAYRELLFFLIWRDIKVRYKQTVLGMLWVLLQPIVTMLVFTVVFHRLVGVESGAVAYPVFSLAGLLPWTFFSQGLTQASSSLVNSSHLVTKVYFPRVLIPAAAVLAGLADLLVCLVFLITIGFAVGFRPTATVVLLPWALLLGLATTLAGGLLLSALNVRYRDIRYLVPFAVQLLLFTSPVIYPATDVTAGLENVGLPGWLYGLNPVVGFVEGFRFSLIDDGPFPLDLVLASSFAACIALGCGLLVFRRIEREFADIV